MPFQIIEKDIMKMKVDEVINFESQCNRKDLCENVILSALSEAHNSGCKSIAIPIELIDKYKVTRNDGLKIVSSAVKNFLVDKDMLVYLVIKKDDTYTLTDSIYTGLNKYLFEKSKRKEDEITKLSGTRLENLAKKSRKNFSENVIQVIEKKRFSDNDICNKANIDRKKLLKIRKNRFIPNKLTAVALAVALEMNLDETRELLSSVDFSLSPNNKFDLIIQYFLENKVYDIYKINLALFQHGESILG